MKRAGFTLLEVMMALLLLATAVMILVQSQTTAVHLQSQATRINTATMLARQIFTELDIRMAKEGFGELEVKETGDFNDQLYDGEFDDYRWEYEIEKLEVELPGLGNLMGMMGEGTEELGAAAGVNTGGQAPQSDLAALGALGFDFSFLTEQMGKYLREARVRICWEEGTNRQYEPQEECLEVVTHMANPTGRVLSADEQMALENYEDAGGDAADLGL
jgi:general secretion pathway protein I